MLNKLDRLNRFYKVVDRGELGDSEVIEHFKELNMIIPAPWSSDEYIVYIGKGKPQWTKLRRSLKVCGECGTLLGNHRFCKQCGADFKNVLTIL